jgi:hypothetical protein
MANNFPAIWKAHYNERWYRCDKTRERLRRDAVNGNWYKMYTIRRRMDRHANVLLDTVVCQPSKREATATELVRDMGYDIWDNMSLIAEQGRASEVTEDSNVEQIEEILPKKGLTRKYWARQILNVIARVRALNIWLPLANSFEAEVPFEHALAALSGFFGEDVERVGCKSNVDAIFFNF